jgi:hypothetical protein
VTSFTLWECQGISQKQWLNKIFLT